MIRADELSLHTVASHAVNDVTIDPAVAIEEIPFLGKMLVLHMNMEGMRLHFHGTQLPTEILTIHPETELIGVGRVIPYPVVNIVVRDAGPRTERNLSAKVGKEV